MNRRELLKIGGLTSAAILTGQFNYFNFIFAKSKESKLKHWAWVTTDTSISADEWKRNFAKMRNAGIDAILPEIFDSSFAYYGSRHLPVQEPWLEKILSIAKSEGLEVHAWMWTMICNIEKIYTENPDWYMVNGRGESCLEKPAYVGYYRFLCPSRPEPTDFISARVQELAQYEQLDGIHLDYIRYPDVIIAEALQPKYGINQDREYPEYDYCYCEVCRKAFKDKAGLDPLKLQDPAENAEWRQYRYDTITNFVNNKLVPIAKKFNKQITAAVFPPYNRLNVRQQWPEWNLDAVLPMLYHSFYWKGIDWIKDETQKGIKSLKNIDQFYSGLLVSEFSPNGLTKALEAAISGGAKGIALFPARGMTDAKWKSFQDVISLH